MNFHFRRKGLSNSTLQEQISMPPSSRTASLRSKPLVHLWDDDAEAMLKKWDFFDGLWHEKGKGLKHQYEALERSGKKLVIDHATGLMWQQGGSPKEMDYADAARYIRDLNNQKFAGYSDWRLPTLEEAM